MADAHSITTTKRCSKCGETKLIDNFGFQKRRKDGHNPWCRACKSIAGKEYEARYKERRETQRKNWLDANRDKHNAYHREYSKKNRERVHAAWKKWRDKNPEKVLQWARDDYWRNREARLGKVCTTCFHVRRSFFTLGVSAAESASRLIVRLLKHDDLRLPRFTA